jgi:hypothetical protein
MDIRAGFIWAADEKQSSKSKLSDLPICFHTAAPADRVIPGNL